MPTQNSHSRRRGQPRVLMIDVGGSNVKLMATGRGAEMVKFPSGARLRADEMAVEVRNLTQGWEYDCVTLGFPGLVRYGAPAREPLNLGGGWMEFDYDGAFGRPVRIINDAALQALANYEGGRMLFIGFGTSIGCAFAADGVLSNVEAGLIPLPDGTPYLKRVSKAARKSRGQKDWQEDVCAAIGLLRDMFWPDDTVIGGGNAKHLDPFPADCRRTSNSAALKGAERLWPGSDMLAEPYGSTWRVQSTALARDADTGQAAEEDETPTLV